MLLIPDHVENTQTVLQFTLNLRIIRLFYVGLFH